LYRLYSIGSSTGDSFCNLKLGDMNYYGAKGVINYNESLAYYHNVVKFEDNGTYFA